MARMPSIDLKAISSSLNEEEMAMLRGCLNKGVLRSTKPKEGKTAFLWRMLTFELCWFPPHSSVPYGAHDYLFRCNETHREQELTNLAKKIAKLVNSMRKKS